MTLRTNKGARSYSSEGLAAAAVLLIAAGLVALVRFIHTRYETGTNSLVNKTLKRMVAVLGDVGTFVFALPNENEEEISAERARVYLLLCAALYGTNYVFTKHLQESIPPSALTLVRFACATLFFVPTLLGAEHAEAHTSILLESIHIGLWSATGFITQSVALEYASASKVAFFTCLAVVIVPLLDTIYVSPVAQSVVSDLERRPCSPASLVPPLVALLGVGLLEFGGMEPASSSDLLLLSTPISFAVCLHKAETLCKAHPAHTSYITGVNLATVSVVALLWTLAMNQLPLSLATLKVVLHSLSVAHVLLALVHTSVVSTAWTSFVEQKSIKVLSAAETTLMYTLEPLFAAAVSVAFFGEQFTRLSVLGGACIVSACVWSSLGADILARMKPERNEQ